ncbi:MAG TPA: LptE family protein [bacterium]|nr:LptE family protein [bacterium]
MKRTIAVVMLLAGVAGGCFTLGERVLPESIQTVYIPYIKNQTMEYGVEEQVTDTLIREFVKDGRLKVVSHPEDADSVLEGHISKYDISPGERNAAGRTISHFVDVSVVLTMRDLRTGEVIMEPTTFSEGGVYFLSTLPGRDRQTLILARLCEDVISRVIEGW